MCIAAVRTSASPAPASTPSGPQPRPLDLDNCRQWLDAAFFSTDDAEIRTMIEDLDNDLLELGAIDPEMNQVVVGALDSVASAIAVSDAHAAARALNPRHLSLQ